MAPWLERLRDALAPGIAVEREIASGGMGHVAFGRDTVLDRPLAIKVLQPEKASAVNAERFLREARSAARLRHPNVVRVHHSDQANGLFYYTMDYIEWETLAQRLARGPLRPREAVRIAREVLAALAAAHASRLVHRDVKPSNIFVDGDRALLSDFGIAFDIDAARTALTGSDDVIGTLAYLPPEQLCHGPVTARTDVYAVGLVLFEALAGRRWMPGGNPDKGDWSGVPEPLQAVLRRALRVEPPERWPSAEAFSAALAQVEAGLAEILPSRGPWRWYGAGLAVAAALLAGVSAYRLWLRPDPQYDLVVFPFTSAPPADSAVGPRLSGLTGWSIERLTELRLAPRRGAIYLWHGSLESPARRLELLTGETGSRYGAWALVRARGPTLEVQLRVITADGEPLLERTVEGRATDIPGLGDLIAHTVTQSVFSERRRQSPDALARVPLAARTEFLLGEEAVARDAWLSAERHYRRAFQLDPTFVLAGWRLGNARRWLPLRTEPPYPPGLWQLYQQYPEALPALERHLIEAQFRPSVAERFDSFEQALRIAGGDPYPALLYGDELLHRGPLAGRSLWEAVDMLERAVAADSSLAPAWEHLAWALIRLGERERAGIAVMRLERLAAGLEETEMPMPLFLRTAFVARFEPERAEEAQAALLGSPEQLAVAARGALSFDLPEAEAALGAALAQTGRTPALRANGLTAQGIALFTLGRPQAGLAAFDSARLLFAAPAEATLQAAEWRVVPAALGMPGLDSLERERGRAALRELAADTARGHRAAWALALDAHARGDAPARRAWAERVRGSGTGDRLLPLLDALEEADRGDWNAALALSDAGLASDSAGYAPDPFYRSALHLFRGQWLARTGSADAADRAWLWYENLDLIGWPAAEAQPAEVDWALGTFARSLRARLAADNGRSMEACGHARAVARAWSAAEPAVVAQLPGYRDLERGCNP